MSEITDRLEYLIKNAKADFIDIRYEIKRDTVIRFSSKELKQIGSNTTDGYVVRALKNGGFGTATVTRSKDVKTAVNRAIEAAMLISKASKVRVGLAKIPVVKEKVKLKLNGDPRNVELKEKLGIVKGYNDLVIGKPEISSTDMSYFEIYRQKHYISSEGAAVSEELMTLGVGGEIVAKRGALVQNVRMSIGGSDGMKKLYDRDDVFLRKAKIAKELLDAEPAKGGTYNVILNPGLTGVFVHEAFGHFSEADIIEDNPTLRKKMCMGAKLGSDAVNIIADSTMPEQTGYYKYDDEGVAVRPITLMEKGVLSGRLHSRRTAENFGESVTGHNVAEDYKYSPIVRMGTIYIKTAKKSFDELCETVGNGMYLCDGKGGQTAGESFTFGAQFGYKIENGKVGKMVREINLMGNLFTTLKNITDIGSDFELSERGGCGKGPQLNVKSTIGGPHIVIRNAVVGGV